MKSMSVSGPAMGRGRPRRKTTEVPMSHLEEEVNTFFFVSVFASFIEWNMKVFFLSLTNKRCRIVGLLNCTVNNAYKSEMRSNLLPLRIKLKYMTIHFKVIRGSALIISVLRLWMKPGPCLLKIEKNYWAILLSRRQSKTNYRKLLLILPGLIQLRKGFGWAYVRGVIMGTKYPFRNELQQSWAKACFITYTLDKTVPDRRFTKIKNNKTIKLIEWLNNFVS